MYYTNFCQSKLEKLEIFAELEIEKIKFPNWNLNSDISSLQPWL